MPASTCVREGEITGREYAPDAVKFDKFAPPQTGDPMRYAVYAAAVLASTAVLAQAPMTAPGAREVGRIMGGTYIPPIRTTR